MLFSQERTQLNGVFIFDWRDGKPFVEFNYEISWCHPGVLANLSNWILVHGVLRWIKHNPFPTFVQDDNRAQSCLLCNCRMTPPLGLCPLVSQGLDKEPRNRQQKEQQCVSCFPCVGRFGLFVVAWLLIFPCWKFIFNHIG